MRYLLRRIFYKNPYVREDKLDYWNRTLRDIIAGVQDELELLKKLTAVKEHVNISGFEYDHSQRRYISLDEQREAARQKGYTFVHRKLNEEEVWAKYP